jgi:uncharacterized membrane protein YhhN
VIGFAGAMAIAVVDWVAVARAARRLEALLKPLVPLPLIAVALVAHAWWFAAALALCLAGDVFLLPQVDRFRSGLAAFLLAHLAFIAAFLPLPLFRPGLAFVPVELLLIGAFGSSIVRAAPAKLRVAVTCYVLVIAAMFGVAASRAAPLLQFGALLFVVSDGLLGWNRFVKELPGGRVAVMVTYHLAIGLLTLSLLF